MRIGLRAGRPGPGEGVNLGLIVTADRLGHEGLRSRGPQPLLARQVLMPLPDAQRAPIHQGFPQRPAHREAQFS